MKGERIFRTLTIGLFAGVLALTGCSTTESRISDHPELFQSLSPKEQSLVSQGKIEIGMSQNAVWLAWGGSGQKSIGNMRGRATETWIYFTTTSAPYGYGYGYGYGYPYGYGYGPFYGRFGFGGEFRFHHGHRFLFYGDPFYDPFFSYIPPTVSYPSKTVTFANGRVVSYQYLVPEYH